jgi:hypothetical protein
MARRVDGQVERDEVQPRQQPRKRGRHSTTEADLLATLKRKAARRSKRELLEDLAEAKATGLLKSSHGLTAITAALARLKAKGQVNNDPHARPRGYGLANHRRAESGSEIQKTVLESLPVR